MTDGRRPRPRPWPVISAALATFVIAFVLLAAQLRAGRDPALGAGVAASPAPRTLIVRRVVVRRVVVDVVDSATPARVARAAPPATVSNAPVPAPAPAPPPPPPIVTRSS
jgi:hypothetical protein